MSSKTALALLAAVVVTASGCGESVVKIVPFSDDIDGHSDSDTDLPGDTTGDDGPAMPTGTCDTICWYLATCAPFIFGADDCGSQCARMRSEVRACFIEASSSPICNVDEVYDCFLPSPAPPGCDDLCGFVTLDCGWPWCGFFCPIHSDLVLECAAQAALAGDCARVDECMMSKAFGTTCAEVCVFAADDCGLAIGSADCLAACNPLSPYSASFACLDTATHLADCQAISNCF